MAKERSTYEFKAHGQEINIPLEYVRMSPHCICSGGREVTLRDTVESRKRELVEIRGDVKARAVKLTR